jgi:hypothetical protein
MFLLEGGLTGHNCGTPGKPASAEPKRTKMKKTPKVRSIFFVFKIINFI